MLLFTSFCFFFFKFIYFFRERGERREKERQRNINVREKHQLIAFPTCSNRDQICNPSMCPDQESNPWPFSLQDDTHPTESHWSGLFTRLMENVFNSSKLDYSLWRIQHSGGCWGGHSLESALKKPLEHWLQALLLLPDITPDIVTLTYCSLLDCPISIRARLCVSRPRFKKNKTKLLGDPTSLANYCSISFHQNS